MKRLLILMFTIVVGTISVHAQTVQCQTANGAWGPCPLNASVQLFNAQSAIATATAPAQKVYNFSMNGVLIVSYALIGGTPSGCTLQVKSGDSLGNLINNGSAITTTPSNGTISVAFTPASAQQSADQISVVYACTTYPSAGTISVEFVPTGTDTISGTVSVTGVSGSLPVNITQTAGAPISKTNPLFTNIADGTNALTSDISAYGTAPTGTTEALGVNAFITNAPTVGLGSGSNTVGKVDILGNSGISMDSTLSAGSAPTNGLAIIGQYNSTSPTPGNGNTVAVQLAPNGSLIDQTYRRSQIAVSSVATTSGTPSTLFSGIAGTYIDLTSLTITTPSSNTSNVFTASITDGTVTYVFDLNTDEATGANTISITFNPPLPMSATGDSWKQSNTGTLITTHTTVVAVKQTANF